MRLLSDQSLETLLPSDLVYDEIVSSEITRLCRACDSLVRARQITARRRGMRVADVDACLRCGLVGWIWHMRPAQHSAPAPQAGPAAAPGAQLRLW